MTINQPTNSSETVSNCSSYTWAANGQTYTQSGTYTSTFTNTAGCLSTQTLYLTINQPSNSTLTESVLDSFTLNGQTYTQSGTYTQVIPNAGGCDSTITLNLTLNFTGLNELQTTFTIAPNPTMEILTITSSKALFDEFVLFDPNGRKVLSGTLTGTSTLLDLSKLSRGNYILQIGEQKTPVKILKQ